MARTLTDIRTIMRRAIGRRNENDPESTDTVLTQYVNDFYALEMSNDVKLFEQFGTLEFTIDETVTDGVYTFNNVGASEQFINIVEEGFITLTSQAEGSTSWNELCLYQNPNRFFGKWGVNNTDVLTAGYPTELLFYGNELTFRTIPDTSYDVILYAYKKNADFSSSGDPQIPYDWWLRYIAYGAARLYATDFRLSPETVGNIEKEYRRQKTLNLTRSHNQFKKQRGSPSF